MLRVSNEPERQQFHAMCSGNPRRLFEADDFLPWKAGQRARECSQGADDLSWVLVFAVFQ